MAFPLDTLIPPHGVFLPAMPEEAPLAMPVQDFREKPGRAPRPGTSPRLIWLRRALVFGAALLLTIIGAREMALVLDVDSVLQPGMVVLVLFVPLFAWIALSFVSSLCGVASVVARGGRGLGIDPAAPLPRLATRSALLMPVYNEDPRRVLAGLEAMHEALREAGAARHFDVFILSDTTDPDAWAREEEAFLALRARAGDEARIFYRRRPKNTDRKAGNIADWVRRHGAAYPCFLILDADSVMSAEALIRMAAAMEAHPRVGLIQSLPVIVNGRSLFARMQQFAGRLYGPVIAHGIAFWHGAEGNYWGHNAMIRTEAFASAAGLPHLPGRKPFGGTVMSHDFVEAALMRRRGWAIHFIPALPGSYEESPPALSDLAIRDRRWCQGNLQHLAVLPARGLHPISRSHLLVGIGSYITAPMWLAFLICGVLLALQARFVLPVYFPQGPTLFPDWPVVDPVRAKWVFIATMGLLLLPKVLAWGAMLLDRSWRRGHGGALPSLVSVLVETVLAGLLAPVTMLTQSVDVVSILRGKDSGWSAQTRDDGSLPLRAVARLYWRHTAFGIAFGIAAFLVSPYLAAWMSPVVIGLAMAIPLAAWTARRGAGQALRRAGLLLIPEERSPPSILRRTLELRAEWDAMAPEGEAVARLRANPALLGAHRAMLPAPAPSSPDRLDVNLVLGLARVRASADLGQALASLSRAEKAALLADPTGLDALLDLPVR
ncbi:glucans biosynthesis glucosyltransferase MdoH [Roseomonas sp. SSH11]|uniref:Glucans biosynthesis glucosyltransferase H n=1 Tax=Pararoseomonas baculiformis TaxID=2820812 RepID=A0ABS4ADV8_9PROT|nr:glucans biosynthesis glucosyltransferase MdoH [Pararoseomonas baculiformis]MBP0445190.1 glucans biosynthesis glucosyltransferase MdoH [Pararoseomonas baculiformis]